MAKSKKDEVEEEPKLTDLPGIGPGIATKLEAAGIYDLMGLAVMSPSALSELAGVGSAVARKAIQAARGLMKLGFMDGSEFDKKRADVAYVTTGSESLNALLGGKGIESKSITEAYGAFGSGKCVSKDTEVCYFNDTRMHVQTIQETYDKYKEKIGEEQADDGFAVPVESVKVMALVDNKFKVVQASHLYKEMVKNLFVIRTKRGRILKVTGRHQLLGFERNVSWKPSGTLKQGDIVACPGKLDIVTESVYDEDDAYFLGMFAAEGSANPFSISTGSEVVKDWLCGYIKRTFGYLPRVREDNRREKVVYGILLRDKTRSMMDGLDKCNSATKYIPEAVFLSNESVVASFLAGYLDGDGEVSKLDVSMTTKSLKLASQLSYLFLRLGVATSFRERIVDGKKFGVIRVNGDDRVKLSLIPFKIKQFKCVPKNSFYGYPRQIIGQLRELYKESIGGNLGKLQKTVGKNNDSVACRHLTHKSFTGVINEKTLDGIELIFKSQKDRYGEIVRVLENSEFTREMLLKIYSKLPFSFNSLSEEIGVEKSSMRNYILRAVPDSKKEILRKCLIKKLNQKCKKIQEALELIESVKQFSWDVVESVEVVKYDDFVYDFVVPEGHSFIGGNMPTVMHNTQLALTLAVNAQLPKDAGGASGKAVYIDTEGTFRPDRIRQIAEGIGANPEKVLKNILVARAFNSDHQILLLDKVTDLVKEGEPIRLLIIDSLTAHFRAEFSGRGQLADRQQKLNRYLHNLMKLAEQHNLAVYVTNQVMSNPAMMFGDPTTAIGGNIVGHACLTGDSLIQLADGGISEIKEMKSGNVFSGNFSSMGFENVESEQTFVNPDVKEIYNIKTNNQINCSGLHRFFTVENFDIKEKEAKDLRVGDFVAQAARIDIEGENRTIPRFKVKKIGKLSKESVEIVKDGLEKKSISRRNICDRIGITPRQFRRVLNQEYVTSFEVLDNLQNYFSGESVLQLVPVVSYKHRDLVMPEILEPRLAQIFGYFWGDGNLEQRGVRFRDERREVLEIYSRFFKEIFNLGGKISKVKDKNCYSLDVNSKEIRDFFEFMIHRILNEISLSKKEVVRGFVRGFFDAEGHINKRRVYVSVSQKESEILRYLQMFMLRFGIRSTIKYGIGKKKMNILRIIDRCVEDYLQIGFSASDKEIRLNEIIRRIKEIYSKEMMPIKRRELISLLKSCGLKYSNFLKPRPEQYLWVNKKELRNSLEALMNCNIKDRQIKQKINFIFNLLQGDISFEKIREINIFENNGKKLYDFSVPLRENYVANGFIVHNSTYRMYLRRGKQGSRVAKLIDSPNLPDNEAVFFVGDKGIKDD